MPQKASAAQPLLDYAKNVSDKVSGFLGVKSSTPAPATPAQTSPDTRLERANESFRKAASAPAQAAHPATPRTSQRAQTRRSGTAAEYHKK